MQYRPEIDGLRALAVIPVVLFHAKFPAFHGGFLGVDIFFVISGYLITSNILRDGNNFSLLKFYEKRARRILPALFVVLFGSALAAYWLLPPAPLVDFSKSLIATLAFVANIYFWQREDYFAEPSELTPLLHTWSLAVEEQFYVFFPLALIVLRGRPRTTFVLIIVAGLGSLLWASAKYTSIPSDVFYLAQFRAWQLLAGAAIAWLELHHGRKQHGFGVAAGLVLIIGAMIISDKSTPALFGSVIATAGTTLIVYFSGKNLPSQLLSNSPVRWIGLISYSLYLWHQPIFAFARSYSINALTPWTYASLIAASAAMACLSYVYIERPARCSMAAGPFSLSAALTASSLLAFGVISIVGVGLPLRYTTEQLAILNANPARGIAIRDGQSCRRPIADACTIGDSTHKPTFAVLGDSHAETLTNAISAQLEKRELSAIVLTAPACPLLLDGVEIGAPSKCAEHTREALAEIERRGIKNIIINERSPAYFLGPFDNGEGGIENEHITTFATSKRYGSEHERLSNLYASQAHLIEVLLDRGVTIYYVLPIPEAGWHVPRALIKAIASKNLPLTTNLARYIERNGTTLLLPELFRERKRFIAIYPADLLCRNGRCITHIGSTILYTDTDHLSDFGAEIVVNAIFDRISAGENSLDLQPTHN